MRDSSRNNNITANEFAGCNISIFLGESDGNRINENSISDAYWGIWLDNSSQVQIQRNNITSRGYGILLLNGSSISVAGNLIGMEDGGLPSSRAALLANVSGVDFQRNEIIGGHIGLAALECHNNSLQYNDISRCSNALYIQDAIGLQINNNSIREGEYGIRLDNTSRNTITGNQMDGLTAALDLGEGIIIGLRRTDLQTSAILQCR